MALSHNKKRDRDAVRFAGWDDIDPSFFEALACPREIFEELQNKIMGTVVLPGDPDYDTDRKLSNPLFDERPQVIVYCVVENDVYQCLAVAHKCRLAVSCRSGGHSTTGYSSNNGGMLLDTSKFDYVMVDPVAKIAWVGPGCHFGKLNATLNQYRLHVPGGGCPDVCPGGYMQGGGYGFTSRIYGMHCDSVVEVRVMLADGRIVVANEMSNYALYWGIRGGTGNNFGVLLGAKYKLYDLWQVWGFSIVWPLENNTDIQNAGEALYSMQQGYMVGAPATFGYMTFLVYQSDDDNPANAKPYLIMRGLYNGTENQGITEIQPLLDLPGAQFQYQETSSYNEINKKLLSFPHEIPQFPEGVGAPMEDKQARYVAKPMSMAGWRNLVAIYLKTPAPNKFSTLVIEPYGGAINEVPKGNSAFIHRDVLFDIFLDVFWYTEADRPAAEVYLKTWTDFMEPVWNGHVYQNYPNRDLTNFAHNYWGSAYDTLRYVKAKYDPTNFFRFPQGIVPLPQEELDEMSEVQMKELALDQPIDAERYSEPIEAAS
jgi:FAD/FMN-containing dehydrogenase